MKKAAILLVNAKLLAEMLQIPAGSEIDLIAQDIERPDIFKIRIIGAGFSVDEGDAIPCVAGTANMKEWIPQEKIDWGIS